MVHDTYGTVLEVNKTGSSRHLWYSAELPLPHDLGSIENPIFAVYPGGHWANETFQKAAVSTRAQLSNRIPMDTVITCQACRWSF